VRDQLKLNENFIEENLNDLCASLQKTIIDTLLIKLKKAAKETGINQIAISGGVSANSGLRNTLLGEQENSGWEVFIPKFEYCTDNAAMVAIAGYFKYLKKDFAEMDVSPYSRNEWK
jgi:N6-L-threonylcarbamoyladenine synthase